MYQGASTNGGTSSSTGRSRNAGRRRRKKNRKSNPSPTTWILLAGGVAAVTGVGIGVAMHMRKKRKAQQLPPAGGGGTGGGGTTTGGGGGGGGGGGSAKIPAPPFTANLSAEGTWARAATDAAWGNAIANSPNSSSVTLNETSITDVAFDEVYGANIKIPPASQRGAGWQNFVDAWMRIRSQVRSYAASAYPTATLVK
jgi:hypothetical protein